MEVIPFPLFCQKSEQYLFFVSLKNFYDVNTKKSKNHILWHHLQKNLKRELSHHLSLLIEVMSFPFSEAGQTIHDSKLYYTTYILWDSKLIVIVRLGWRCKEWT